MASNDSQNQPPRHRLLGLEIGRFIAALIVACFHYWLTLRDLRGVSVFNGAFLFGHAGVEYFFVLSGFIIYYIHRNDLGQPGKLRDFALKRVIRIYPMYFLVFVGVLVLGVIARSQGADAPDHGGNLLADALLLPMDVNSVVHQSWSLRHEIVFYVFFSLMVLNARVGFAVFLLWLAAVIVVGLSYGESMPLILKPFFYIYNIGFAVGMACAWVTARWTVKSPGLIASLGALMFATCASVEWWIGGQREQLGLSLGEITSPLLYIGASALIIIGVTRLRLGEGGRYERALQLLGGCSYLLYLVHTTVGSVVVRVFNLGPLTHVPNELVFVVMLLAAIVGSLVLHVYVEKPTLGRLRKALLNSRKREAVA